MWFLIKINRQAAAMRTLPCQHEIRLSLRSLWAMFSLGSPKKKRKKFLKRSCKIHQQKKEVRTRSRIKRDKCRTQLSSLPSLTSSLKASRKMTKTLTFMTVSTFMISLRRSRQKKKMLLRISQSRARKRVSLEGEGLKIEKRLPSGSDLQRTSRFLLSSLTTSQRQSFHLAGPTNTPNLWRNLFPKAISSSSRIKSTMRQLLESRKTFRRSGITGEKLQSHLEATRERTKEETPQSTIPTSFASTRATRMMESLQKSPA